MEKRTANTKNGKESYIPDPPAGKLPRSKKKKCDVLKEPAQQVEALRARVEELEQTLDAIRKGEVDALIVPGNHGEQVYSLEGANHPYRVLIEAMNEGAVTIQPDGIILHINRCFAEMTHTPAEQLIGSTFPNLVPPAQRGSFNDLLGHAAAGGAAKQEFALQIRGGGLLPVLLSMASTKINALSGVILVVTDLTERKAAEETLLRANSNLALKVEERTRELAGANRDMRDELNARQRAEEELSGTENRLRQANGKLDERVAELLRAAAEIADARRAALNLMEDAIKSRQTMENVNAQLRESEDRFRTVADNISQLAWTCDKLGDVTWYNRRWLDYTGLTFEEMKDWGWKKVHHPDHVDRVVASVRRSRESGEVWEDTFPLRGKDGKYRWFLSRAFPIRDEDGKVKRWFGTNTDVTVLRETEAKLAEANEIISSRAQQLEKLVAERTADLTATNKQLEAFVYSIAHDLRAPLRAMQGFSSMLVEEEGAALSEMGQNYAQRIDKSAQFMDSLLADLLAFSRISQQRLELTFVKLEAVVESVLSRFQSDIEEKKARVETSGPWPSVLAHEPTLAQVLFNLVNNALKFVAPDTPPLVRLRAEEQPESIRIWIEDNGIGIAPDYQEQIFRLFTRLHGEKYEGTGIGLAIVQKGVERMGGRAGVESALGQGSRFWFELRKGRPSHLS